MSSSTRWLTRRALLAGGLGATVAATAHPLLPVHAARTTDTLPERWALKLIKAGRAQIGVTVEYDGAYEAIAFPGGDIPRERGVCTDVIIRAYRDAFDFDLQRAVNADMKRNFRAYPNRWGLKRPDRNIDHRRVPNLRTFFRRQNGEISGAINPTAFRPGDLVTQVIGGRLPHIGIVSDRIAPSGRPFFIHNIGAGTLEQDVIASFPITGHYRFNPG